MKNAEEWTGTAGQPANPAASDIEDPDEAQTLPLVVLPRASFETHLPHPQAAAVLDLGDKDCGDGPLEEVARALRQVPTGAGLEVLTSHADVTVALLVWCRLVGHDIVEQTTGRFLVVPVPIRSPRLPPLER